MSNAADISHVQAYGKGTTLLSLLDQSWTEILNANFISSVPSSTRIQCRPFRSSGSGSRSLSHARSAPPPLKMMGITVAGECQCSFTFFAAARVRVPKHTLSASTTHARHAACCAAVWTIGPPAVPAPSRL